MIADNEPVYVKNGAERFYRNVQPWYRIDDFICQTFYAWWCELDQLDRWTSYESPQDIRNVLSGLWLYPHEGILSAWFARKTSDPYLSWWEDMLGIPTDATIPDSYRRSYLIQRMQQRGVSPTVQFMEGVAEQFVTDAVIIPNIPNYTFTLRIISPPAGVTPPQVLSNLDAAINAAKPAHLGWNIIQTEADWYTLATDITTNEKDWQNLGNADWSNVA
jgi:hypothetical protein